MNVKPYDWQGNSQPALK